MSTFAAFVESVANLSVTGVRRRLLAPPAQVGTADLPLSYPRIPAQEQVWRTFGGTGVESATVELVVVVAPDTLSTKAVTFAEACALVDNLNTALATLALVDRWTIRQTAESFDGQTGHTVLVATVEGSW